MGYTVKAYTRNGKPVRSHTRGGGKSSAKGAAASLAKPRGSGGNSAAKADYKDQMVRRWGMQDTKKLFNVPAAGSSGRARAGFRKMAKDVQAKVRKLRDGIADRMKSRT